jgi:hypothetical protein
MSLQKHTLTAQSRLDGLPGEPFNGKIPYVRCKAIWLIANHARQPTFSPCRTGSRVPLHHVGVRRRKQVSGTM